MNENTVLGCHSEWSENHTKNSCSSSPFAPTLNIFHQVNVTVEATLWGGRKAVSSGIISAWMECWVMEMEGGIDAKQPVLVLAR